MESHSQRVGKKLHAMKAWKSFSNKVQPKVHRLNKLTPIKATLQRLLSPFYSLHHLKPCGVHRSLRTHAASYYHSNDKNTYAISIHDLYAVPASSSMHVHANMTHAQGETSRGKGMDDKNDLADGSSDLNSIEDAWRAVVARSPELQVDDKAEEFIKKFYEDIRLQKERSLQEFQEMLARGA